MVHTPILFSFVERQSGFAFFSAQLRLCIFYFIIMEDTNMKKLLSLALIFALTLSFAACDGSASQNEEKESDAAQITQADTKDIEETEKPEESDEPEETEEPEETDETEEPEGDSAALPSFKTKATIEKTVLVDEDDYSITATKLSYNSYYVELSLSIENKSEQELVFSSNSYDYKCNAINGYMVDDGYLYCTVAAGKKAIETMTFEYSQLMLYGILEVADIELGLNVSNSESNFDVNIPPIQILTSAASTYDYDDASFRNTITSEAAQEEYDYELLHFSEKKLLDQDGISIFSGSYITNEDGELSLFMEIRNDTDEILKTTVEDVSINGLNIGNYAQETYTITPSNKAVAIFYPQLDANCWDVYEISEVGNVSLTLSFSDIEDEEVSKYAIVEVINPDVPSTYRTEGGSVLYDENDLKITALAISKKAPEYSDDVFDVYIMLLVENNANKAISIQQVYNSASINGYKSYIYIPSLTTQGGEDYAYLVEIRSGELEEIGISSFDEVKEIEFSLEISNDKGDVIDEPEITLTVD